MHPAVAQSLPQSLVGDVQADDQVQLAQTVQGSGLGQSPGKTYTEYKGRTGKVRDQEQFADI